MRAEDHLRMSGPDYGHLRHPGPSFTVSFDAVSSRSSGGVMKLDVHPSCLLLLRQCILHMTFAQTVHITYAHTCTRTDLFSFGDCFPCFVRHENAWNAATYRLSSVSGKKRFVFQYAKW